MLELACVGSALCELDVLLDTFCWDAVMMAACFFFFSPPNDPKLSVASSLPRYFSFLFSLINNRSLNAKK